MTTEAKRTLLDIYKDPDTPQQIRDYMDFKRQAEFTPTDPTLLALQTTVKDPTKTVAQRQAALDQLFVISLQPDPVTP